MFWLSLSRAWEASRLSLQTSQRPECWAWAKDGEGTQPGQLSDSDQGIYHTRSVVLRERKRGCSRLRCLSTHESSHSLSIFSPSPRRRQRVKGWVGVWLLARVSPPRMSCDRVWATMSPCHVALSLEHAVIICPNQHPQTSLHCAGSSYKHPRGRKGLALPKSPFIHRYPPGLYN